jgi:HlyD family secretion protein
MDDLNSNINILDSRIKATQTQLVNINAEKEVFDKQLEQLDDQIRRAKIRSPIEGTVLEKYVEESEVVSPGLPLLKMANLESMILRAYVTGSQLSSIQIGQKVSVYLDQQGGEMAEMEGIISWISSQAEFTPKIIQTKEERVNLVYAIKIRVVNDGSLKVGMPGEVRFNKRYHGD